jgi:hypothetical protein
MRKCFGRIALAAVLCATALPAAAELQNVIVGGQIRIRANYYRNAYTTVPRIMWPAEFLPGRAIGGGLFGGNDVVSIFDWDDNGNDLDFVEQRTRLNVNADFTDEVSAFIEIDSYDWWGEDFRSDYVTGADFAADSDDDVEIYQAYIQAEEMWGTPLRLRVGRQELSFGNEWLVGTQDTSSTFTGLSFDAIRLTYATDLFSVDAWASKLAENGALEEDGDVDFYGVYASYLGLENITLDAYWMLVRDAVSLNDTNLPWIAEWVEDALGLDDYDPSYLHTVGLRGAGTIGAFDFNAEAAYQFGDADSVGFLFNPGIYGDDDADFDAWGGNLELGYTFDMSYTPRIYIGAAYFEGEDNRDLSFWEWLNPFNLPEASVSFNRLFSNWEYSEFLENSELSNVIIARAGISASPTQSVDLLLSATYFWADEPWDAPRYITIGRYRVPIDSNLAFWTQENDDELGLELGLYGTYHYSEDLTFNTGWAHLFVDDGLSDGSFTAWNGLVFGGGTDDDDADYVFLEAVLSF